MVARDDVRRIELKVAKMLDCLEDGAGAWTRRAVKELRVDREATCLGERDLLGPELLAGYATGTCGCVSGARSRKLTRSSSDSGDS